MLSFAWRGRIGQGRLWSTQGRHADKHVAVTRLPTAHALPDAGTSCLSPLCIFLCGLSEADKIHLEGRPFTADILQDGDTDVRQFRARLIDRAPRHMKRSIGIDRR